jgi:Xaa-Pro aminopeptidase
MGRLPEFGRSKPEKWTPNLERIHSTINDRELDGLIIQLRQNVLYMSGYASFQTELRHESEGTAVVFLSKTAPNHPILVLEAVDISHVVTHPTWIEDVRAYHTHLLPPDVEPDSKAFDRFAAPVVKTYPWGQRARATVSQGVQEACRKAASELGLKGRIGFDNLTFAQGLDLPGVTTVDAYSTMKFIRQVKTPAEVELLREAHRLNEIAIANTIRSWSRGMTWLEVKHIYDMNCLALGGWVQYGGGIVLSNADSEPDEAIFQADYLVDDSVIEPASNIMLDCHGQLNHYRWDGGKTWVVDDELTGTSALIQRACEETSIAIMNELRPGKRVHEVQTIGREIFRKLKVPEYDRALVFFHGMGLDHTDIEIKGSHKTANWTFEENMAIATHVAYPGDRRTRYYIEDVGIVRPGGGETLYKWGVGPHVVDKVPTESR